MRRSAPAARLVARRHDLRHSFASTAVASGQGLPVIGKLLGHTQVQTTARQAHLAADPVMNAAYSVATSLRQSFGEQLGSIALFNRIDFQQAASQNEATRVPNRWLNCRACPDLQGCDFRVDHSKYEQTRSNLVKSSLNVSSRVRYLRLDRTCC